VVSELWYNFLVVPASCSLQSSAPVAQLDRASGYESILLSMYCVFSVR